MAARGSSPGRPLLALIGEPRKRAGPRPHTSYRPDACAASPFDRSVDTTLPAPSDAANRKRSRRSIVLSLWPTPCHSYWLAQPPQRGRRIAPREERTIAPISAAGSHQQASEKLHLRQLGDLLIE